MRGEETTKEARGEEEPTYERGEGEGGEASGSISYGRVPNMSRGFYPSGTEGDAMGGNDDDDYDYEDGGRISPPYQIGRAS